MIQTTHTPTEVIPDLAPKAVKPNQLVAALNMRVGLTNPLGQTDEQDTTLPEDIGCYRIAGNVKIYNNAILPSGQNYVVGSCKDIVSGRIFYSVWNEDPAFNTQFQYTPSISDFQIIDQGAHLNFRQPVNPDLSGYVANYYVHMEYLVSGLLTYEDGLNEDRVIDPALAIAGFYDTPIPSWVLAQLHRPPAIPLDIYGEFEVNTTFAGYIAITNPKPVDGVVNQGYQFGYNYGYKGNIESRISEPSIVNWNNGPYLIVPDYEFTNYITNGASQPNPYIEYVKFYYRIGNTGEWNLFRKVSNEISEWLLNPATVPSIAAGYYFGFILPDMDELVPIGGLSGGALNPVDGIPINSRGSVPANNRLIKWYLRFGYNLVFPTAPTVAVANYPSPTAEATWNNLRKWRINPPIEYKVDLAEVFKDEGGRVMGTRSLGAHIIPKPDTYIIDLQDIVDDDPSFNFDGKPWATVVDYFRAPSPPLFAANSSIDANNAKVVSITPTAVSMDSKVASVGLIVRPHIPINSFTRTLCRPFWVYESAGSFRLFLNQPQASIEIDSVAYAFYGFGFMFNSGEGINFDSSQELYLEVRGQTLPSDIVFVDGVAYEFNTTTKFKITDQQGEVLISRQPYAFATSDDFWITSYDTTPPRPYGSTTGYYQIILDVILYNKTSSDAAGWVMATDVNWTRAQYLASENRMYNGDSFFTSDQKFTSGYTNADVFYQHSPGDIRQITWSLGLLSWTGYFGSMNLNGIYQPAWDSDQGSAVALNPNPKETTRTKGLIHGQQYLPDTEIDNTFVFDPGDTSQIDGNIGAVVRVGILSAGTTSGDNIYCLCEAGSEIRFLGKIQQTASTGEGVQSLSTNVFGNANTQPNAYGIQSQKQAVFTQEGMAFYFDEINNVFVQLSLAGQDPISLQQSFASDMRQVANRGCIGYDPFFGEIVFAAPGIDGRAGFAYNWRIKKYQGKRTYGVTEGDFTEMFEFSVSPGGERQIFAFVNGEIFIQNAGPQMNAGEYDSSVTLVSVPGTQNHDFLQMQYYNGADNDWDVLITTSTQKQTTLTQSDFKDRKRYFEAAIKRNINSTGTKFGGGVVDGMWAKVKLSNVGGGANSITFVRIGSINSLTDGNN